MKKIFAITLVCGFAAIAVAQQTQQNEPTLGDIARKYRAAKKPGTPARVIDNDTMPSISSADSTSSADSNPAVKPAAKAGDPKDQTKASPTEKAKLQAEEWKTKIDAQKHEVSLLQRELDVMEHQARIRAATYYADAGEQLRDPGKYAEDTRKQQGEIDTKKQALDTARQKLEGLQEQARKAGMPASVFE